jgi:hypothetical protein
MLYSDKNQLERIEYERNFDGLANKALVDFTYNQNGQLIEVMTTNSIINKQFHIAFQYYENGTIAYLNATMDGETKDWDLSYSETENQYTLEGELATMPMVWRFAADDQMELLAIAATQNEINHFENEKGAFHDVAMQPAHHIWHGLTFIYIPFELLYFSKTGLNSTKQVGQPGSLLFSNHLRDPKGYPISFKATYHLAFSSQYTIAYETLEKQ